MVWLSRLFLMLKYFPLESKGRQQKLREVGRVASICFCCFMARCIMMCFDAFNKEADLDVLDHPVLNFLYYLVSTISAKNAKLSFCSVCIEMICSSLVTPNWCLCYYIITRGSTVLIFSACSLSKFFLQHLSCTYWGGSLQSYSYRSITSSAAARGEALSSCELKPWWPMRSHTNARASPLYNTCTVASRNFPVDHL